MSTPSPSVNLEQAMSSIPKKFRTKIIASYLELKRRYSEAHFNAGWDTSGLSAGKFCEAVFRFLQEHLTGTHIAFGQNIPNFPDECRKIITLPTTSGPETLRIIVPRGLVFLYTLRGKRGIGHVGGDVDANEIDAATVVRLCDWIICELIRVFHGLSLEEAQSMVDAIAIRTIPDIWEVAGKKRVLRGGLDYSEKVLLLLYSNENEAVLAEDLFSWTEYSNFAMFKKAVLLPMHRSRLIEYDTDSDSVHLSPKGASEVEEKILPPKGKAA